MEYQGPSPVVQSNLPPLYTSYHKRTPSSETPVLAASPATSASRRLFGFSPRSSSRQASPKVDSAISPPPSARLFASGKSADTKDIEAQIRRGDSPALGPAPSPSKSPRFGFLSKRPKDGQQKLEKSEKKLRRGPAAGTGHEGYGRFGLRGRSASTFSGSSADRSTSADSAASSIARTSRKGSVFTQDESDLDDFLKERLTPVVLRGNGSSSSVGASTGNGGISEIKAGAAVASPTASSVYSDDSPQIGALPLGLIIRSNSQSRPLMGFRKTSGDSESGASASQPSLTARHSARRSQLLGGSDDISTPISTEPSMTAPNDAKAKRGSVTSLTKNREPLVEGNESLRLKPKRTDTLVKGPRKWNFFQRAHASSNTLRKEEPKYQNTAHYALIDTEPVDLDEVEQLVQEDRAGGVATDSTEPVELPKVIPYERRHSTLLPSPRAARKEEPRTDKPSPPKLLLRTDSAESPELLRAQTARPAKSPQIVDIPASPMLPPGPPVPRLSPVGRIPRVVSKRDRERKLPDQSFSRPFAKSQPRPTVKPPGTLYTEIRHLASPVESQPNSSTTGPSEIPSIEARGTTPTDPSSASVRATPFTDITTPADEFIAFPPRKNSELSYTSSSGTASIPDPRYGGPGLHGEEDVWHEYNDLLDEVMPQKTPLSAGSSLGAPFQYADPESDNEERHPKRKRLPHLPVQYGLGLDTSVAHQFAPSVEASKAPRHLSASLQPLTLPSSPYSISEIVSGYDERTTSMTGSTVRHSLPSGQRSSLADSRTSLPASRRSQGSTHTRSLSVPDASSLQPLSSSAPHIRDSRIPSIVEDDSKDPMTEINLRYGALMTSKWLSFGRVLFSPAHIEAESGDNVKVLVVDGLGKDWSYYCAMTYPTATFYNLGPDSATEPSVADPAGWKPLTNHRQIQHLSMSDPFPFPKGFFSAVVLRFPQATSDKVFHQCIYECKRVLQPGGYLEISALDLDLMSMGTRARKAVMNLKMRMQQADSNVSLRNLGDVMMRLVGRRGFENIQRCVVGVPAAGRIPRSQDMSSISSGSSSKKGKERAMSIVHEPSNASLADLVNDAPATAITGFTDSNDEGITKMVAKVGRWWYSTCYESAVTATTNPPSDSIWDTPGLLRECERHGTSFRLLICYAQKPTCAKRRTVSV
ncbi:hypothetical protein H2203_009059 [Taxawa tesnikishii (nom. ined.)]|nr:hypothetical protein H2203_009059 [Dothideales sp. JES 119]